MLGEYVRLFVYPFHSLCTPCHAVASRKGKAVLPSAWQRPFTVYHQGHHHSLTGCSAEAAAFKGFTVKLLCYQNMDSYVQSPHAGSGKTLAFLLPVVASLHQQPHQHSSGLPSNTATDKAQADKSDNKKSVPKAAEPSSPAEGPRAVPKGPGAVVLAPSRELAAQTARCLVRLVKGLRLHCCLLTAAVAAGTDFTKVNNMRWVSHFHCTYIDAEGVAPALLRSHCSRCSRH